MLKKVSAKNMMILFLIGLSIRPSALSWVAEQNFPVTFMAGTFMYQRWKITNSKAQIYFVRTYIDVIETPN